jgi:Putative porin
MRFFFSIIYFFSFTIVFGQQLPVGGATPGETKRKSLVKTEEEKAKEKAQTATIDMYRVVTMENDTTYIDTTLTIKKEYSYNYLRKDIFGLLPFANEGQTYQTLQFGLKDFSPLPEFGFAAKHFNYLSDKQIKYYSVATPLTELYFKTVMEQGQSLDAFFTINTSERFNFSLAYKGLRSFGRFSNQLSSAGNFRFTSNYQTKNKRYAAKAHVTVQDLSNGENGGIINNEDFESNDSRFTDRIRLQTYLQDASSLLEGNRYFIDHSLRINKNDSENNLILTHQFNLENKFFQFKQPTISTQIVTEQGVVEYNRFGQAYATRNIDNKTRYERFYNRLGLEYENKTIGKFQFFADDFYYKYFYNSVLVVSDKEIPSFLKDRINSIGGQYVYQKDQWYGYLQYSNSISKQSLSNLDMYMQYTFDDENIVKFQVQKINKLPNLNYNLFQSSYVDYNWSNNFKNEKINNIKVDAETKWATASFQLTVINDKLYFSNDSNEYLSVTPKQAKNTINYLSLKLGKEITFGKFALDNTILYQQVAQEESILNVPKIVTRNSFYFTDKIFKNALFLQTGFIFNYFTKYAADDYNPLIGEFYVQTDKKIGAFPMVDFFINAKVRQTRIYLKAEHFNTPFTAKNYYTAPNYPYRDWIVRFGLVWNFFK